MLILSLSALTRPVPSLRVNLGRMVQCFPGEVKAKIDVSAG